MTATVVLRGRRLGWSVRLDARAVGVTTVLLVLTAVVFAWSLSVGDFPIPVADVVATLLGGGDQSTAFIVENLRLPRGLDAVLVGAAFGLSGAIFQRITRNPLASPDMIGINGGAAVGAVFVIVMWNGTATQITLGALLGAVLSGLGVYLLAYKRGITGFRLVLVGIGVAALLSSLTQYLVTRAEIYEAQQATVWLTGSLNSADWSDVRPLSLALALLVPLALASTPQLRLLELGDDAARGLGARVARARTVLVLVGAALAAVATAVAGPVGFVALAAPQIARRLVGPQAVGLVPAAACGALLMLASDLVGRRLFAPNQIPVGVVTAVLGAPYLLYLLARANRIGRG